jgi:hypothetical protein
VDEDIMLLVSEATKNVPEGEQWPGSEVRWCHLCGDSIWLSQEALQRMDVNPRLRPTCGACATPMMQDSAKTNGGKLEVHKVDPRGAPMRPILDYLKREYGRG